VDDTQHFLLAPLELMNWVEVVSTAASFADEFRAPARYRIGQGSRADKWSSE